MRLGLFGISAKHNNDEAIAIILCLTNLRSIAYHYSKQLYFNELPSEGENTCLQHFHTSLKVLISYCSEDQTAPPINLVNLKDLSDYIGAKDDPCMFLKKLIVAINSNFVHLALEGPKPIEPNKIRSRIARLYKQQNLSLLSKTFRSLHRYTEYCTICKNDFDSYQHPYLYEFKVRQAAST